MLTVYARSRVCLNVVTTIEETCCGLMLPPTSRRPDGSLLRRAGWEEVRIECYSGSAARRTLPAHWYFLGGQLWDCPRYLWKINAHTPDTAGTSPRRDPGGGQYLWRHRFAHVGRKMPAHW